MDVGIRLGLSRRYQLRDGIRGQAMNKRTITLISLLCMLAANLEMGTAWSATKATVMVFPNVEKFVHSYLCYTPSCTTGGIYTIDSTTSPQYGTRSDRTQNYTFTEADGICIGNTFQETAVYYTWTGPTSGASQDSFSYHVKVPLGCWSPADPDPTYPVQRVPPPKNLGKPNCCEGNPVNPGTGNKLQIESDYAGAPNIHLEFRRYYNSQDASPRGTLGYNWHSTYHRGLTPPSASGNSVQITRADGRVDTFTRNSAGAWQADPDVTSRLSEVKNASGQQTGWKLVLEDDTLELYALDGRLTSISTRAGLKQTLTYNADKQLTQVTGPFGHKLTFSYDFDGLLEKMTAPGGKAYGYAYSNNNLVSVTYPGGAVRQYLYENPAFIRALTGITDENGQRFATYAYDAQGRAISTEHAGGVEKVTLTYGDGTTNVTDPRNYAHSYNFSTQFDVVKPATVTGPCLTCEAKAYGYDANGFTSSRTDRNGRLTTYVHNARGLETSRTEASGTALARTITTQWHATFHLPTKITEPNRVTTLTYDTKGNLLKRMVVADTQTRTWTYTYNSLGQVLSIDGPRTDMADLTTFTYGAQGNLATATDALGRVTRYTAYDANGRLLSWQDPNGLTTTLTYDARGRLLSRTEGTEATQFTYDAVGQLKKIVLPSGATLAYTYDAAHRLIGVRDALGNRIAWTLDKQGNRVGEKAYDPANTLKRTHTWAYDGLSRMVKSIGAYSQATIFAYDANGNLTKLTDPLNQVTAQVYDALNRLIRITGPNGGVTRQSYDASDRLTGVTDPRGLVTAYAYDGLDVPASIQSPDTGATTNTYDAAGNLLSSTDARGLTTTYAYDALNRVTQTLFADGKQIVHAYDQGANGLGRLTQITDPSGTTAWTYDAHGRVLQKQQTVGTATLTVNYAYDAKGRLSQTTYPSGRQLTYTYDAAGQIQSLSLAGQPLLSQIRHQPFGPVAGWVWSNGTAYSRTFNLDGRLTAFPLANGARTLTYDAAGRVTALVGTAAQQSFGYDALDRLTQFTNGAATQDYAYDGNGNRTEKTVNGTTTPYAYASTDNRLAKVGYTSYVHDAAGHVLRNGPTAFTYDARGRLAGLTTGAGVAYSYGLNGLGQRVSKTSPALSTGGRVYVYDEAGHLIGEYDRNGARVQEHVYLGDTPVAVIGSLGAVYYALSDHLDTPRQIVNTSNQLRWRWDFADPFGANVANSNPAGLGSFAYNLRFPGQYYDGESGLHYNGFRDYDPRLGRYIESDPIGLMGGVNTYAYVGGNPLGWVDPTGLLFEWMGGPWTGFGSDVSTPGNLGAAASGALDGATIGGGIPGLFKAGRALFDGLFSNCPGAAKTGAFNPASRMAGEGLGTLAGREVSVSQKGLDLVENHLTQFGRHEPNVQMVERLRSALQSGQKVSGADASFYLHEAAEATMMRRGVLYDAAHDAALGKYGVSPYSVYHPEVIQSNPGLFNSNWRVFWGLE
jgi:RHS repeat-associated protein